jgi:hypothetical protein
MTERREYQLAQLLDVVAPTVGLALIGRFLGQVLQMPRKGRRERRGVLLADDGRTCLANVAASFSASMRAAGVLRAGQCPIVFSLDFSLPLTRAHFL